MLMANIIHLSKKDRMIVMRMVMALTMLFALTACPAPGPNCVMADDWGDNENLVVKVPANRELTSSGINGLAGEPLYIDVNGTIDLCPFTAYLDEASPPFAVNPRVKDWQYSNIQTKKDKRIDVYILSAFDEEVGRNAGSSYVDRRGSMLRDGIGLYGLIVKPSDTITDATTGVTRIKDSICLDDGAGSETCGFNPHDDWFYPDPTVSTYPQFFELYENNPGSGAGIGSQVSGYHAQAPIDGMVFFKYARTARNGHGARNLSSSGWWDNRWSPWRGRFAWHEPRCVSCFPPTIEATCHGIASAALFGYGAVFFSCRSAWYGACASRDELPDMRNCQWVDHWKDESYENNVNGYQIVVSTGCPGENGQHLETYMLQDGQVGQRYKQLYNPRGCTPGTSGCHPELDQYGRAIRETIFELPSGTLPYFSNDPAINPLVNAQGVYDSIVPSLGEIWFRIDDLEVTAKDLVSHPPGCSVEPVGCVQKVHPDVNPSAVLCHKNYVQQTDGSMVQNVSMCAADPDSESCEYSDPTCEPPIGYSGYSDNIGSYEVRVKTTKVNTGLADFIGVLIKPIRTILFGTCRGDSGLTELECVSPAVADGSWKPGIVKGMYNKLIGNSVGGANPFVTALRAAILLYIIIYGFQFMLGMVDDVQRDFVYKVLRLGLVQQLLSPGSWEFFNTYLFTIFIDGLNEMIAIIAGSFIGIGGVESIDPVTGNPIQELRDPITGNTVTDIDGGTYSVSRIDNPFVFVNYAVTRIFSVETLIKISGLIFASPLGILYIAIILYGIYYYIFAVFKAVALYLLALIGIGLQVVVSPIFIGFVMFERTRGYFNNWLNHTISFFMQPVLVITALAMFNIFIVSALYMMLHYTVCWQCLLDAYLDFGELGGFSVCFFKFYYPWQGSGLSALPMGFFIIVIFLIMVNAMLVLTDWMASLASELASGMGSVNLAQAAGATVQKAKGLALSAASMAGDGAKAMGGKAAKSMKKAAQNKGKDKDEEEDEDKDSGEGDGGEEE